MAILTSLLYSLFMALYFGVIRMFGRKNDDFWHFFLLYTFALLFLLGVDYTFVLQKTGFMGGGSMFLGFSIHILGLANPTGEMTTHFQLCYSILTVVLYYLCPTFVISYLLYPFKTLKRNRILIWIMSAFSVLILGIEVLLLGAILLFRGNM